MGEDGRLHYGRDRLQQQDIGDGGGVRWPLDHLHAVFPLWAPGDRGLAPDLDGLSVVEVSVMVRASRTRAIIQVAARRAQALMATDVGLLSALIVLFIVSGLIGLWVGIILLGW